MPRTPLIGKPLSIVMTNEENLARYFNKPPTRRVVSDLMAKLKKKKKISTQKFEVIFGMPNGTIRQFIGGFKDSIPAKYWHFIYDYRELFKLVELEKKKTKVLKKHIQVPTEDTEPDEISELNKKRIDEYRRAIAGR